MKTLNLFVAALFVMGLSASASAQTPNHMNMNMEKSKTETLKVLGNCDMCKTRIEKAVNDAGATSANWDQKTKLLTLSFDPSKSGIDAFAKTIAGVGHDTENFKADDKVYDALPGCCKYERTALTLKADYTCPMHSDVHSDKAGKCPECGMTLVKKEASMPVMNKMKDKH